MKSESDKFMIVKANKTDLDVRKQMAEIFAEGSHNGLSFFPKIKTSLQRLLLICLF